MVSLGALWLPIVLSAVIVFIASSIMHTVLKYHNSDYKPIPDEDKFLASVRPANLRPGLYVFPFCTHKTMKSPEVVEKFKQGPVGFLTVRPCGAPAMGKFLAQWFVYCLVIAFFVAYLAAHTLPFGIHYLKVFRVVGTAAILAYGLSHLSDAIWKGQTWSATIKEVIDGVIYGLLTAGTFGWLWPR
jgi:hypothetical protein